MKGAARRIARAARYRVPTEAEEQGALLQWCAWHEREHPELALLFAIPNGELRHPAIAKRLKAQGVKAGVPDLMLPVQQWSFDRTNTCGLFIEMKRARGGRVSREQAAWHRALQLQGYRVELCHGWIEAAKVLAAYLDFRAALDEELWQSVESASESSRSI